jgi:pimeloyl-ACP methyl ester carboxylesterase
MRDHFVAARDGVQLFVAIHGAPSDRPPVVCIPGLTRNGRDFEAVAPALAADRLVAVVDLRGRGRSGWDPSGESYALDTYVDDVVHVLDDLGLVRALVVGTSLGGFVAMWLAARHPARVAAVVLNDIGPELQTEGLERIRSYAGQLPDVTGWSDAVAQTRLVGEVAFPDYTDADWERTARRLYRETDGRVAIDHDPGVAAGRLSQDDPWEIFVASRELPMLLVRGALTDLLAPTTVAQMVALHPRLEVVEVPNRGHAPTLEEPVARDALLAFVATSA